MLISPENGRMTGQNVTLRLVDETDAAFIHALRNDPRYNLHLSHSVGTVEDQAAWIRRYKPLEAEGREFYFVIGRLDDGRPCGVVRIYGIADEAFTWGSWILNGDKPPLAALDSAMLVYRFGFDRIGCQKAVFDVRRDNARTLAFHDRFGAQRLGEDAQDVFYEIPLALFRDLELRHKAALETSLIFQEPRQG